MTEIDPKESIAAIKKSLLRADWWQFVQPDVKHRLEFVVDNLLSLGSLFRDSFVSAFKYEHAVRVLEGRELRPDKPGAMFGRAMTDECYHSAIPATKLLLNLNDWVKPNDADIQACMHVCQQIDTLEQTGLFGEKKHTEPETDKAVKETITPKPAKKKKATNNTIHFKFDNE